MKLILFRFIAGSGISRIVLPKKNSTTKSCRQEAVGAIITNALKPAILPAFILLSHGCDKDDFSQVVNVHLPAHESKIVLYSHFSGGQKSVRFNLSNTLSILDTADYSTMKDAKVHFFINGKFIATADGLQKFRIQLDEPLPYSADSYEIKVESPGYPTARSKQIMPPIVRLSDATLVKSGAITPDGRFDEVTLEFNDPGTQENYYLPRCLYGYQYLNNNNEPTFTSMGPPIEMESMDPLLEDAYTHSSRIISDKTFNGRYHKMKLYFDTAEKPKPNPDHNVIAGSERFGFQLVSITKEGYLYWRSLAKYQQNKDNPFSEPVVIYSNIENGRGAFFLEAYGNVVWQELK